jgi:hypothetical protein
MKYPKFDRQDSDGKLQPVFFGSPPFNLLDKSFVQIALSKTKESETISRSKEEK